MRKWEDQVIAKIQTTNFKVARVHLHYYNSVLIMGMEFFDSTNQSMARIGEIDINP